MKLFYAFVLMVAATAQAANTEEKTPLIFASQFSKKICEKGGVDCKKSLNAVVDAVVSVRGTSSTSKRLYAGIDKTCATATCGDTMARAGEILNDIYRPRFECESPKCNQAAESISKVIGFFEESYNQKLATPTEGTSSSRDMKINFEGSFLDLGKVICAKDNHRCLRAAQDMRVQSSELFKRPEKSAPETCLKEGEMCSGVSCCDPFFCLRPEGVNDGPRYCRVGDSCRMPGGNCNSSNDCCGGFVCKKAAGHRSGVCK